VPDDLPSSPIQPFRPLPDLTWHDRADAFLARFRDLERPARLLAAVAGAVVAVVLGFVLLRPDAARSAPEDTLPRASAAPSPAAPSTTGAIVVVQAAGAVVNPGLYRLAHGTRVDDLVRAAGGLAPDADADRVNLAALLTDGQKVYIPRIGEALPADIASPDEASSSAQVVDLNTASAAQLETLPGVGPATAQAIIDYRSQHGAFRSVDDLLNVRGIGPAKLDAMRALVRV
jgi:competence protein ComEA